MNNSRTHPQMARAGRLDISNDGTDPTIVLQADDGTWHYYPLTPPVAATIIKRLAGALVHPTRHMHTFRHEDDTDV